LTAECTLADAPEKKINPRGVQDPNTAKTIPDIKDKMDIGERILKAGKAYKETDTYYQLTKDGPRIQKHVKEHGLWHKFLVEFTGRCPCYDYYFDEKTDSFRKEVNK